MFFKIFCESLLEKVLWLRTQPTNKRNKWLFLLCWLHIWKCSSRNTANSSCSLIVCWTFTRMISHQSSITCFAPRIVNSHHKAFLTYMLDSRSNKHHTELTGETVQLDWKAPIVSSTVQSTISRFTIWSGISSMEAWCKLHLRCPHYGFWLSRPKCYTGLNTIQVYQLRYTSAIHCIILYGVQRKLLHPPLFVAKPTKTSDHYDLMTCSWHVSQLSEIPVQGLHFSSAIFIRLCYLLPCCWVAGSW